MKPDIDNKTILFSEFFKIFFSLLTFILYGKSPEMIFTMIDLDNYYYNNEFEGNSRIVGMINNEKEHYSEYKLSEGGKNEIIYYYYPKDSDIKGSFWTLEIEAFVVGCISISFEKYLEFSYMNNGEKETVTYDEYSDDPPTSVHLSIGLQFSMGFPFISRGFFASYGDGYDFSGFSIIFGYLETPGFSMITDSFPRIPDSVSEPEAKRIPGPFKLYVTQMGIGFYFTFLCFQNGLYEIKHYLHYNPLYPNDYGFIGGSTSIP